MEHWVRTCRCEPTTGIALDRLGMTLNRGEADKKGALQYLSRVS
jgi:hypothetical protein